MAHGAVGAVTTDITMEAIGWLGSALCLGAYLLTSMGRVSGGSSLYHWMNFIGGATLAANVLWHGALPAAFLEVCWALIGLVSLIRIALAHTSERARPNRK